MSEPIAYYNGSYVPYSLAQMPLHDAGVVWGATITDRVRTFRQEPFLLAKHLQRFTESCALANVPLERSVEELTAITDEVLARNKPQHARTQEFSLLYMATPGPLSAFAPTIVQGQACLIVYALPLNPARYQRLWSSGANLHTELSLLGGNANIKHRSRLPWWIAQQKVRLKDPNAEPLFITKQGEVLETTSANFLAVCDGVVVSPPKSGILDGISLGVVQQLCHDLNIPSATRTLMVDELEDCSEAMLCNTSYSLANVAQIDHLPIPFPGDLCARLVRAWSDLVGTSIWSM